MQKTDAHQVKRSLFPFLQNTERTKSRDKFGWMTTQCTELCSGIGPMLIRCRLHCFYGGGCPSVSLCPNAVLAYWDVAPGLHPQYHTSLSLVLSLHMLNTCTTSTVWHWFSLLLWTPGYWESAAADVNPGLFWAKHSWVVTGKALKKKNHEENPWSGGFLMPPRGGVTNGFFRGRV